MGPREKSAFWFFPSTALAILIAYWGVLGAGFVFDDEIYVQNNEHLAGGLRLKSIAWAFTSTYAGNWHPLTWLSHLADVTLFGLHPTGHHLVNLCLHILNTFLLFHVLSRMTGAKSRSAFVSALFALHPLHVESVAWIAERKDVLSTLLLFLGLLAYHRHVSRPSSARFLQVALFFSLGLMAKPMLVTFPFMLLLLDWWPLGRRAILEKAPLLMVSATSSAITFYAQWKGESVVALEHYPLWSRILNAAVAYFSYLVKALWPTDLAVFYPHVDRYPSWQVMGASLSLAAATVFTLAVAKRHPWAATGWLWYLGTLIPVIGIVQVGSHSMADRYTYVPLIGVFLIVAWGFADAMPRRPWRMAALALSAVTVLLALSLLTRIQVSHWKDQRSLYEHALAVTRCNALILFNVGLLDEKEARLDSAAVRYREAIRCDPSYFKSHLNLGNVLVRRGDVSAGIDSFRNALRIRPWDAMVYVNIGAALAQSGRLSDAIGLYQEALRINPALVDGLMNMGNALSDMGRDLAALPWYEQALTKGAERPDVHYNYALSLERLGRRGEAATHYRETLRLGADFEPARAALKRLASSP